MVQVCGAPRASPIFALTVVIPTPPPRVIPPEPSMMTGPDDEVSVNVPELNISPATLKGVPLINVTVPEVPVK